MAELGLPTPYTSLDELITCVYCKGKYSKPKTLPCQHIFCETCLEKLLSSSSSKTKKQLEVVCPQCNELADVPHNKVSSFPASFVIENLLEINRIFEETEEARTLPSSHQPSITKYYEQYKEIDCKELGHQNHKDEYNQETKSLLQQLEPPHKPPNIQTGSSGLSSTKLTNTQIVPGFKYPWGIIKSKNGELIIAEWGKDCVTIINSDKEKQLSFGQCKKSKNPFLNPRGVAITKDDTILVTNGNCLQQFTKNGTLLKTIGSQGSEDLKFEAPAGLAIHPLTGDIYIADANNHRIQVLSKDLTFLQTFGHKGTGQGEFFFPWDVAIDSKGQVYVVSDGKSCVHKFTAEGMYLDSFGTKGSKPGQLNRPSAIAIDQSDQIFITELYNNRISVFDAQGEFKCFVGEETEQKKLLSLNGPCGIAVHSDNGQNELYVTDCWNDRIIVFTTN